MPFTYTRIISDEEMKCLENDLVDVKQWIDQAIDGKINKCFKRIVKEELEKVDLTDKKIEMPRTVGQLIEQYFKKPGYKCRREREDLNGGQITTPIRTERDKSGPKDSSELPSAD